MKHVLKEMFGELSAFGKFWLYVGLLTLIAAALMSFDFGWSVSWKHALFLALLSVITAFAPEAAYRQWQRGTKGAAIAIIAVCAPLFAIEFYSHAGYTAGLRGHNLTDAKVQNVKYAGAQEAVSEDKTNLSMWQDRLQKLEAQYAWLPTVTSESLQARLASANLAIEQESKRGGCGPKCLERTKERDEIASRMNLAGERADLTKKIEATKSVLAKAREKAETTEFKHSSVDHQNQFLAKAVALVTAGSLEPSELLAEGAQQSVNLAMAVSSTGPPALARLLAGPDCRRENELPPLPQSAVQPSAHHHRPKSSWRQYYTPSCEAIGATPVAT